MVMSRGIVGGGRSAFELALNGGQIVRIANGNWYEFTVETVGSGSATLVWRKSTDSGRTWGARSAAIDDAVLSISVWYDRWTPGDTTGNLIHIAWLDITDDNVFYANLDTTTDTVSSTVTVFDG